jgi:hypothetical protein
MSHVSRWMFAAIAAVVIGLGGAAPASAATCSDFANQAQAQAAANTTDANHDGIYCNDLPCPCAGPSSGKTSGESSSSSSGAKATAAKPKLGVPVLLSPVTKTTGCLVDGPLPDAACSPGAYYPLATKAKVCKPGYAGLVRNVSQATKNTVYREYGITTHFDGSSGEVDHLVSLELGGANSIANLFPEAAAPRPGSHEKDKLENALHSEVCSGKIGLRAAQRLIAGDWVTAYNARF